jgi:hypothetical protein
MDKPSSLHQVASPTSAAAERPGEVAGTRSGPDEGGRPNPPPPRPPPGFAGLPPRLSARPSCAPSTRPAAPPSRLRRTPPWPGGEREKGRKGEREKGRKGEREEGRKGRNQQGAGCNGRGRRGPRSGEEAAVEPFEFVQAREGDLELAPLRSVVDGDSRPQLLHESLFELDDLDWSYFLHPRGAFGVRAT